MKKVQHDRALLESLVKRYGKRDVVNFVKHFNESTVLPAAVAAENAAKNDSFPDSFDKIYNFSEGYAVVRKGDKYNFIDKDRNILSEIWFDVVSDFHDGLAVVCIEDRRHNTEKWNYIDGNGNLLSEEWFGYASKFSNGRGMVRIGREMYFIDKNGELSDID